MKLSKKYRGAALITGASAGLGKAFAWHLAAEGMEVILVARRKHLLEELAESLRQEFGTQAFALAQDLTKPHAAEKLREQVAELQVEVGMLINNAGFGTLGRFDEQDAKKQEEMVELNCRAPVALTTAFLPQMLQRGNGAIVFLASTASYQSTPYMAVYGATKVFNLHLGEALWAELKPRGIDVIALSPGFTRTEFQQVAGISETPPRPFFAEPEEVVRTCFKKLGKKASVVHGSVNCIAAAGTRLTPRSLTTRMAGVIMKPRNK